MRGIVKSNEAAKDFLAVGIFAVCFAMFFTPEKYVFSESIYRAWQMTEVVIGGFFFVAYIAKCRIGLNWLLFIGFFTSSSFLSSVVSDSTASTESILFTTLSGIGFVSLACYGLQRHPRRTLYGFSVGGCLMCAINFISFLIYRNTYGGMMHGIYMTDQNYFFLGYDNITLFYYLPVAACLLYCYFRFDDKIARNLALVFFGLSLYMYISLFSVFSMAVFVVYSAFILALLNRERAGKAHFRGITYKKMVLFGLGLSLVVFAFSESGLLNAIAGALGKSNSISDRIRIWENAVRCFSQNPLFGVGVNNALTDILNLSYDHAHNALIQILYQGGLVSLSLFVSSLLSGLPRQKTDAPCMSSYALIICVGLWLIAGCADFSIRILPQYFPVLVYIHYASSHTAKSDSLASL